MADGDIVKMGPAMAALPDDDRRFLMEYVTNGYRKGPAYLAIHPNVTFRSARELARRLLRKVEVKKAKEELALTYHATKYEIYAAFESMAEADMADYDDGFRQGKTLVQMRDEGIDTRNVKSLTIRKEKDSNGEEADVIKVELYSRSSALSSMGKARGMFIERHVHSLGPAQDDMSTAEGQVKALEAFEAETRGDQDG